MSSFDAQIIDQFVLYIGVSRRCRLVPSTPFACEPSFIFFDSQSCGLPFHHCFELDNRSDAGTMQRGGGSD